MKESKKTKYVEKKKISYGTKKEIKVFFLYRMLTKKKFVRIANMINIFYFVAQNITVINLTWFENRIKFLLFRDII